MPPEFPAQPETDEAIDAIVYDVHPALAPPPWNHSGVYPYAPGGRGGTNPFQAGVPAASRPPPLLQFNFGFEAPAATPADYVVPQRFGISAILGITTALAVLFGAMHWLEAEPVWYLFFGMMSIVICLVQMFHGKTPRAASAIAGAIMAPIFLLGWAFFTPHNERAEGVLCGMIFSVPCGAGLGYLTGTCAAGVFLVMDVLEPYLQGTGHNRAPAPSVPQVPT